MTSNKKTPEEIAKEERNAYFREYRSKNKGKIQEINLKYWLKKAEQRKSAEKGQSDETK